VKNILERNDTSTDDSEASQSEEQWDSCGRETAVKSVKKPIIKSPKPTPLTEREHVGGWSRGKCPDPAPCPCPCPRSREQWRGTFYFAEQVNPKERVRESTAGDGPRTAAPHQPTGTTPVSN
jgi:hypothetical protein